MPDVIIIKPNNPEYSKFRRSWNTRYDIYPKVIVQPCNERGVQKVINHLRCGQWEGWHFAIRGGGHCPEPWSSSDGILIQMSRINHVNLRNDIAYIGAGAVLGDINRILNSQGRCIPTGTCPSVGIGGQGLTGGVGYNVRKYGLLIDSIVGYRVVLADGQITEVNSQRYPDLFWALRGAGAGNFCVVTEYQVQTYPTQNVTTFIYNYPLTEHRILEWLTSVKNTSETSCQAYISESTGIILKGQTYDRSLKDLPPFPPESCKIRYLPYSEALGSLSSPRESQATKPKTRFFSKPLSRHLIKELIKSLQTPQPEHVTYSIDIQQLRGYSKTCVPWRNSSYWMDLTFRWPTDSPVPNLEELDRIYQKLLPHSEYCYMGVIDLEAGDVYYSDVPKLLEIKKRYDPEALFRYPQGLVQ